MHYEQVGIGGKGQDVIVAAASMGAKKSPLLLQFLGNGAEGDALAALLQNLIGLDKTSLKIESDALSIRTSTSCRTCVTIVDSVRGEATEIVEPSGKVLQEEVNTLLQILDLQFADQKASGVAVMGSMPPGCSLDLYSSILRRICNSKTKVSTTISVSFYRKSFVKFREMIFIRCRINIPFWLPVYSVLL